MHEAGKCCTELLEKTANALDDSVGAMLLAVQRGNLDLSIRVAVTRLVFSYRMALRYNRGACVMFRSGEKNRRKIIRKCAAAFPYLWLIVSGASRSLCATGTILAFSAFQSMSAAPCFSFFIVC